MPGWNCIVDKSIIDEMVMNIMGTVRYGLETNCMVDEDVINEMVMNIMGTVRWS